MNARVKLFYDVKDVNENITKHELEEYRAVTGAVWVANENYPWDSLEDSEEKIETIEEQINLFLKNNRLHNFNTNFFPIPGGIGLVYEK